MGMSLGFGVGIGHLRRSVPEATGSLLIDSNPILIDSFAIVFS